jgi:hypothetical protein
MGAQRIATPFLGGKAGCGRGTKSDVLCRGPVMCQRNRSFVCALVLLGLVAVPLNLFQRAAPAQTGMIGSGEIRAFVVGTIPVVGRDGAVGGVSVDAKGVVALAEPDLLGRLREVRRTALGGAERDAVAMHHSPLRKISLRRLEQTLDQLRREGKPPSDVLQYLAGLQRVEYLFVDPKSRDLILAGPAEPLEVGPHGDVVGVRSGRPPVQLDDLIVALRTAEAAAGGDGITCSIDPTEEGLTRYRQQVRQRNLQPTPAVLARLEHALGPQQVTITGVPPASHFAHVMLAADVQLKALSMNLQPAPVAGMPSYMELLGSQGTRREASPRFWIAPNYAALRKDESGLAWQLTGPALQVLSEDVPGAPSGGADRRDRRGGSPARQWAESATERLEELSDHLPALAHLRNCMDLGVVAALITSHRLDEIAHCPLALLHDAAALQVASFHVPRTLPSQASAVAHRRSWIVGISGGVELDSWRVLERVVVDSRLSRRHHEAVSAPRDAWWWD